MLKPGKSHTNNLHFRLFTRAENDTNHRVFLSNQPNILLIISTAAFLQRNEYMVVANKAAVNSTEVKTMRNQIRSTCSFRCCKSSNNNSRNQLFTD